MTDLKIAAKTPSPQFGKEFAAYLALPPGGKGPGPSPGIVLIQEIFGVNDVIRNLADSYAKQGYVVACPDIFWRQQPGIRITDKTDAEWARAFELFKGFDFALGVEDLIATLDALRAHPACTGKVAAVGNCLGGNLAYQMACRSPVDAAVSYYGVGIEELLGIAGGIKRPLLMHIAEKDAYVPPAAQAKIKSALEMNKHVAMHVYAGQDHAFAREGGKHYHAASAILAGERTLSFLKSHLA